MFILLSGFSQGSLFVLTLSGSTASAQGQPKSYVMAALVWDKSCHVWIFSRQKPTPRHCLLNRNGDPFPWEKTLTPQVFHVSLEEAFGTPRAARILGFGSFGLRKMLCLSYFQEAEAYFWHRLLDTNSGHFPWETNLIPPGS